MSLTYLEAPHGDNPDFIVELTADDGTRFDPDLATNIWWTVKTVLTDTDAQAVFQKTKGAGISTVTIEGVKKALLTWSAADAAGLEAGRSYYFDVRVRESSGRISTPIVGMLSATPQHATLSYS